LGGSPGLSEAVSDPPKTLTADRIAKAVGKELRALIIEMFPSDEPSSQAESLHELRDHVVFGPPVLAGADFVYTAIEPTLPRSVFCRVTTDGTVQDRRVAVEYRTGNGERYIVAGAEVALTATSVQAFCWFPEAATPSWPIEDAAIAPLPEQWIFSPCALAIRVYNGAAGDLIDQVRLVLRY